MTADQLLAVFHEQVRLTDRDVAPEWTIEHLGPVRRSYPANRAEQGFIESPDGLDDPDARIAAERDFFAGRGQPVEWKTYDYDQPADLPRRLVAAGFVAEDPESLILGELDAILAQDSALSDGVRIHEATTEADFDRIDDLEEIVWGENRMRGRLWTEYKDGPDLLSVYLVETDEGGPALTTGWVRYHQGTDFCSLWGGSTLVEWRRKGLYRALLKHRAIEAAGRGFKYARVDASEDSRPILQRVGLLRVAGTTPYVFRP